MRNPKCNMGYSIPSETEDFNLIAFLDLFQRLGLPNLSPPFGGQRIEVPEMLL